MRDFFHYDHLRLRYDPFPIGLARPLMDPADYRELLAAVKARGLEKRGLVSDEEFRRLAAPVAASQG